MASSFTAVIDMLVDAVLAYTPPEEKEEPAASTADLDQGPAASASGAASRGTAAGPSAEADKGPVEEAMPTVLDDNKRSVVMQVLPCLDLCALLPC